MDCDTFDFLERPVQAAAMSDSPPAAPVQAGAHPPGHRSSEVGRVLFSLSHHPTRPKTDSDFWFNFADGDLQNVNFPDYKKFYALFFDPAEYKSLTDQLSAAIETHLDAKLKGRQDALAKVQPGPCSNCMAAAAVPLCLLTCGVCCCPLLCVMVYKVKDLDKIGNELEHFDNDDECVEAMKEILKKFNKDGRLRLEGSKKWQKGPAHCRDLIDKTASVCPPKGWSIVGTGSNAEVVAAAVASTYVAPPDPFADPPAAAATPDVVRPTQPKAQQPPRPPRLTVD